MPMRVSKVDFDGIERRKEPRHLHYSSVKFKSPRDGNDDELLDGTVINISSSGLCIYSFVPLSEGQKITIMDDLPTKHRNFTVRWSNKWLEDFFVAGLEAIE